MSWFKSNILEVKNGVEIVGWADGTDEQIAAMLQAHYAGDIDVTEYWAVGEKRAIPISAIAATGVSESHHADTYDYVIIGLNHDDLVTPVNGITKAAITCQQDRVFYTDTTTEYNTSYDIAHECGYMNSSNDNSTGWRNCARRTWCNGVYKAALPQYIQDNIQQVYKSTAAAGNSSSPTWTASTDYCWLPSEWEVFGAKTRSAEDGTSGTHYVNGTSGTSITMPKGGVQYTYFANATVNRYKKPAYDSSSYPSSIWWERSPCSSNSARFCNVYAVGSADDDSASDARGLAPAWAL